MPAELLWPLSSALCLPDGMDEAQREARIGAAFATFQDIDPVDGTVTPRRRWHSPGHSRSKEQNSGDEYEKA